MRAALVLVVLGLVVGMAGPAGAADGTLPTGGSHEVIWTPPTIIPVRGPRFAAVTVDVYVALGHPPSYATAELARRAAERASDVRAVVHLYAFGAPAEQALEALFEAAEQGRFYALFDRIVQARLSFAAPVDLARLGRDAGLDGDRLDAALATHRHHSDVERLQREARLAGHHPPELVINGRRVSPWSGDDAIAHAIGEARTRAEALLTDGVPLSQLYERLTEIDEEVPFVVDPTTRNLHHRLAIDMSGAPTRGPSAAPLTIVLWANFACMQCADVAASVKRLAAARPGLVRLVWKHFPTRYGLAPTLSASPGELAAEYAAAAQAQGRFWPLYDLAMASHLVPARISKSELERLGVAAGLDANRLRLELASGRAHAAVERDAEEARRLGVPTAGSVAVNGIPVAGAPSYELLDKLAAAELDAGVLERLRRR